MFGRANAVPVGFEEETLREAVSCAHITENKALAVLPFAGKTWIVTGSIICGNNPRLFSVQEVVPKVAFNGEPVTYAERCRSRIRGESFYNGVAVSCQGAIWCFVPNRVYWVANAAPVPVQESLF